MTSDLLLKLQKRDALGKQAKKLRKDGVVPSVVYSGGEESLATQSDFVATTKVVQAAGRHTPVNLDIDGKKHLAIIKNIDIDPVKHRVRHVAFHAIKADEIITTEAPIELTGLGESPAEKAGLIILQAIESIGIKAKPADLPEALELPVEKLETIEDKLTIGDIVLPEGVEFSDVEQDLELVIANVYEPSALQAANEAAGGDAEEEVQSEEDEGDEASGEDSESAAESSEEEKAE